MLEVVCPSSDECSSFAICSAIALIALRDLPVSKDLNGSLNSAIFAQRARAHDLCEISSGKLWFWSHDAYSLVCYVK